MRTALLCIVFLFFLISTSSGQAPLFALGRIVGVPLFNPKDIAVDSQGYIYVPDKWGVTKFDKNGKVDINFKPDKLAIQGYGTYSISIDQQNNLYLVSSTNSKVAKFSPEGKLLLEFGSVGSSAGKLNSPSAIALDEVGNMYIADTGNKRIQKFSSKGKLLQVININPGTRQQETDAVDLALDSDGNIYVIDSFVHHNILKYSPEGRLLLDFNQANANKKLLLRPSSIAIGSLGDVYIADKLTHKILIYDENGVYQREIYHPIGVVDGYLDGTSISIALDHEGNIFAADSRVDGSKVNWYDKTGEVRKVWGNLYSSKQIAMDATGNVFTINDGDLVPTHKGQTIIMKFDTSDHPSTLISDFLIKQGYFDVPDIAIDIHGNIYILSNTFLKKGVLKFNPQGEFLTKYTDFGPNVGWESYTNIHVDINGNIFIGDYGQGYIRIINPDGVFKQLVGESSGATGYGYFRAGEAISSDNYGNFYVLDYLGARVQKYDPNGKLLFSVGDYSLEDLRRRYNKSDMAVDAAGNIYVASNKEKSYFRVYDTNGNLKYEEEQFFQSLAINRKGTKLVAVDENSDAYTIYHSNTYNPLESTISGKVYHDLNQDCELGEKEAGLTGIIVEATPGPSYGITDKDGKYTLAVEPGSYKLRQIFPNDKGRFISQLCNVEAVGVPSPDLNIEGVDFANQVVLSPHLSVSVSSTRRRRCFESTTSVRYVNSGFATAPDAKVHVQLPPEVELLSADKPYTRLPDGTYAFAVGDLAAGQHGAITIQDRVTCGDESVRGRTVCTKAWITPGNRSPTAPPTAVSIVSGTCDAGTGYVRLVIRNNGQADMETGEQFRVYQDGKLATVENYTLAAGDSIVLRVPAMGRTIRLEADQPDGNGDNTLASATVEACRIRGASTAFSTGFVNAMPTDDEEAEVAEECLPISDSFDPNDKLVMPKGLTVENYTPTGTALKYKIRFQNTGTDVAYRVVVVDTLSEHLDLSTLQLGAASHDYSYEVSGKGRPVLTWTFHNIMLPDSTSDEPGSHGYIQFSIKPRADLPEKTAVANSADIFFDFNSPVRTNVTVNRIYDMPLEIQEENRIVADEVVMTPTITAFSPAAGKHGAEVSITGFKFSENKSSNKVYINGVQAEVLEGNATALKVRVPVGASTGSVSVVTEHAGASSAARFTVYQPPVIAGFSPAEGVVGAEVTLQGNYLSSELVERVQLGPRDCEIIRVDQNAVRVRVPADAVTDAFTVHTKGGAVRSEAAYRVWHAPAITGFDKAMQRVGGRLLLQGENFAPEPNRNYVLFGNIQAEVLRATAQTLEARVPAGARTGTVSLTTPGGTASRTFEVIPAPVITVVYPAKGSVGTIVELQGERFLTMGRQDTVSFGGVEAIVISSSGTSFRVRVPRGAVSGKVVVAGIGGSDEADFEVELLTPSQAIAVFPNPSTGKFTVDFSRADFDVQGMQVFDTTGKLLYSEKMNAGQSERVEISLSGEKAGVFLVTVQTERGKVVKKVTLL